MGQLFKWNFSIANQISIKYITQVFLLMCKKYLHEKKPVRVNGLDELKHCQLLFTGVPTG